LPLNFQITAAELTGNSREAKFAHPRALCVQLVRQFTRASYPMIAHELGGRHHSTIMVLERRAHNLIDFKPELFDRRQAIIAKLQL
jgi:chromosomal replication initiation ATPase DnaA